MSPLYCLQKSSTNQFLNEHACNQNIRKTGHKQQELPSPGLHHPGTSGDLAPRTGSFGADRLSTQNLDPTGRAEAGLVILE